MVQLVVNETQGEELLFERTSGFVQRAQITRGCLRPRVTQLTSVRPPPHMTSTKGSSYFCFVLPFSRSLVPLFLPHAPTPPPPQQLLVAALSLRTNKIFHAASLPSNVLLLPFGRLCLADSIVTPGYLNETPRLHLDARGSNSDTSTLLSDYPLSPVSGYPEFMSPGGGEGARPVCETDHSPPFRVCGALPPCP